MAARLTGRLRGSGPRLAAAALIGFGLAALYEASSLPFGSVRQPDSGFFPTLVALALVVFAAIAAAQPAAPAEGGETDAAGEARIWAVVTAIALYAWALKPVGFLVCTAALLVILTRWIGRISWPLSLSAAALGAAACWMLFTRLGMPLPAGVLAF